MNQTGIYEQLITQLVEQNLDRESFYVGERSLESAEAATWLSRILTRIFASIQSLNNQIDTLDLSEVTLFESRNHINNQ